MAISNRIGASRLALSGAARIISASVSTLIASAVWAQVPRIESTTTSLTSTTKRMISYRDQQHSWQTSDGALHLMINTGANAANQSLVLYSSFDGGATWTEMFALPHSDPSSTPDGALISGPPGTQVLRLVYGTEADSGNIVYGQASYDLTAHTWTLSSLQTAFASKAVLAAAPAMAADDLGGLWCAYTGRNTVSNDYDVGMVYLAPGAAGWVDTGLKFGVPDTGTQHAGRPVPLDGGVGIIYQSDRTMYWAYRLDAWSVSTPWPSSVLFVGLPPGNADPYDTHFSAVADAGNNLYLAFAGNSQLQYMKYTSGTSSWSNAHALTTTNASAAYMKASVAGGNIVLITNDLSSLEVFQSADSGSTFKLTQTLVHPAPKPGSNLDYSNPRVETPSYSASTMAVWQQFFYGSTQGLMFFPVPVVVSP